MFEAELSQKDKNKVQESYNFSNYLEHLINLIQHFASHIEEDTTDQIVIADKSGTKMNYLYYCYDIFPNYKVDKNQVKPNRYYDIKNS